MAAAALAFFSLLALQGILLNVLPVRVFSRITVYVQAALFTLSLAALPFLWPEPGAAILRPSIQFGPEDDFFNRFAAMARMSPALPLIGGGLTKFQPVFVGDVALAIAEAVAGNARAGTTYELGGPEVRTFKELMEFVLATIERRRLLVPLPFALASLKAQFLQFLPKPPLTPDQVEMLKTDNVVSDAAIREKRTLAAFVPEPAAMEAIVPSYLWRFRKTGQFRGRVA